MIRRRIPVLRETGRWGQYRAAARIAVSGASSGVALGEQWSQGSAEATLVRRRSKALLWPWRSHSARTPIWAAQARNSGAVGTLASFRFPSRSPGAARSCPDLSLQCCHARCATPALPSADERTARSPARVDYPEMPATAIAAFKAALVFVMWPALAFGRWTFHGHGLLRSACV